MRKGFTLIEMLVVIGILATLIAASFGSYNAFVKKAARTRCVELVSNAHSALVAVMQKEESWPRSVLGGPGAPSDGKMDEKVGAALAKRDALSLSYRKGNDGKYTLTGNDRCGVVTPWALEVLKRNKNATTSTAVPSGGTVEKHILHYAIDDDYDGITQVGGEIGSFKVRASACVWCCGADGVISPYPYADGSSSGKGGKGGNTGSGSSGSRSDDVYSWSPEQVVK